MNRLVLALALALSCAASSGLADQAGDVARALGDEKAYCEGYDGKMVVGPYAVALFDLNGDGRPEVLVDEGGVHCIGMNALEPERIEGSGGTRLHIVIGGQIFTFVVEAWSVVDPIFVTGGTALMPRPETGAGSAILLLSQHGSTCGGAGAEACIEALIWQEGHDGKPGKFNTVRGFDSPIEPTPAEN